MMDFTPKGSICPENLDYIGGQINSENAYFQDAHYYVPIGEAPSVFFPSGGLHDFSFSGKSFEYLIPGEGVFGLTPPLIGLHPQGYMPSYLTASITRQIYGEVDTSNWTLRMSIPIFNPVVEGEPDTFRQKDNKKVLRPMTDSEGQVVYGIEILPEDLVRRLMKENIILKNPTGGPYFLNPMFMTFVLPDKSIKELEFLVQSESDFTRALFGAARCYQFDYMGRLVIKGNEKGNLLLEFLNKKSPKYESKAELLVKELFGEDIYLREVLTDVNFHTSFFNGKADVLKLVSTADTCKCPCCGGTAKKITRSGTHQRTIQDVPINTGRPLYLVVEKCYRYLCENEECPNSCTMFSLPLTFAQPHQQRTNRLNAFLLTAVIC